MYSAYSDVGEYPRLGSALRIDGTGVAYSPARRERGGEFQRSRPTASTRAATSGRRALLCAVPLRAAAGAGDAVSLADGLRLETETAACAAGCKYRNGTSHVSRGRRAQHSQTGKQVSEGFDASGHGGGSNLAASPGHGCRRDGLSDGDAAVRQALDAR